MCKFEFDMLFCIDIVGLDRCERIAMSCCV